MDEKRKRFSTLMMMVYRNSDREGGNCTLLLHYILFIMAYNTYMYPYNEMAIMSKTITSMTVIIFNVYVDHFFIYSVRTEHKKREEHNWKI